MATPVLTVVPALTLVPPLPRPARSTAAPRRVEATEHGGRRDAPGAAVQGDELEARRTAARARAMSRHPAFGGDAHPPSAAGH